MIITEFEKSKTSTVARTSEPVKASNDLLLVAKTKPGYTLKPIGTEAMYEVEANIFINVETFEVLFTWFFKKETPPDVPKQLIPPISLGNAKVVHPGEAKTVLNKIAREATTTYKLTTGESTHWLVNDYKWTGTEFKKFRGVRYKLLPMLEHILFMAKEGKYDRK